MLLALHKPYGVLSQFTPEQESRWRTLADFGLPKDVYPIGRLDADSEGLLLLTDEPGLNTQLLEPTHGHVREYWVQVDGAPDDADLKTLARGVTIGEHRTRRCRVWRFDVPPKLPPRDPPVRFRRTVPDTWLGLELTEGKNRQVRRMTAAVGHPTLRLIRVRIGTWTMPREEFPPGKWRELRADERAAVLA